MNILLGVTGGIAAYKSAQLIRLFIKNGDTVKVVMTASACRFITPLTMMTLSGNPVYIDSDDQNPEYDYAHIELARWADVMIVAPATANTIAKMAHGIADNLLTSTLLAWPEEKKLFIAPAMNNQMYAKAVTQSNIECLSSYAECIGPVEGQLACGDSAMGVMEAPEHIFTLIVNSCGK